jgi:hypothetical protein
MSRRVLDIPEETIAEALAACGGVYSDTARLLSQQLRRSVSRDQVYRRTVKSEFLTAAQAEGLATTVDGAVSNISRAVAAGDLHASYFVANNLGYLYGFGKNGFGSGSQVAIKDEEIDAVRAELLRRYQRIADAKAAQEFDDAFTAAKTVTSPDAASDTPSVETPVVRDIPPEDIRASVPPRPAGKPQLRIVEHDAIPPRDLIGIVDRGYSTAPKTAERQRLEEIWATPKVESPFEPPQPEFAKGSMQCPT